MKFKVAVIFFLFVSIGFHWFLLLVLLLLLLSLSEPESHQLLSRIATQKDPTVSQFFFAPGVPIAQGMSLSLLISQYPAVFSPESSSPESALSSTPSVILARGLVHLVTIQRKSLELQTRLAGLRFQTNYSTVASQPELRTTPLTP